MCCKYNEEMANHRFKTAASTLGDHKYTMGSLHSIMHRFTIVPLHLFLGMLVLLVH